MGTVAPAPLHLGPPLGWSPTLTVGGLFPFPINRAPQEDKKEERNINNCLPGHK